MSQKKKGQKIKHKDKIAIKKLIAIERFIKNNRKGLIHYGLF